MTDTAILLDVSDRIATITLNRPEARNALSASVIRQLPVVIADADANPDVDVLILTGADPAFCAGLDLKELGDSGDNIGASSERREANGIKRAWTPTVKPLIGAINGVAVTGGFELALNCDFMIASERASFADTHARVGVMPGWGLTVLLPQAIGVRRARELSFTGRFLDAQTALAWGLVNRVVPHDELIPAVRAIAAEIIGNEQDGVRQIRATYEAIWQDEHRWEKEAADGVAWKEANFAPEKVAARRAKIQERGRAQTR